VKIVAHEYHFIYMGINLPCIWPDLHQKCYPSALTFFLFGIFGKIKIAMRLKEKEKQKDGAITENHL
jgi:hypothetical protein